MKNRDKTSSNSTMQRYTKSSLKSIALAQIFLSGHAATRKVAEHSIDLLKAHRPALWKVSEPSTKDVEGRN